MPFTPFPLNVCEVVLTSYVQAKTCKNVWGVVNTNGTGLTEEELDDIATQTGAWVTSFYTSVLSGEVQILSVEAKRLANSEDLLARWQPTTPLFGAESSIALSNQVNLVTTFRSQFAGRAARGRSYLVGIPAGETQQDSNYVSESYAQRVQDAWAAYNGILSQNFVDMRQAILSRSRPTVPPGMGIPFQVVAYRTGLRVDTQRRRLPKE